MNVFFDPRQLGHAPETYFRGGAPMPHPEQPARAVLLHDMLKEHGFPVLAPADFGLDPITAVHDPDYVDFFRDAYARFQADAPEGALAVPTRHPGRRRGRVPQDIHGAMGWWMTDTSTPLQNVLDVLNRKSDIYDEMVQRNLPAAAALVTDEAMRAIHSEYEMGSIPYEERATVTAVHLAEKMEKAKKVASQNYIDDLITKHIAT